MRLRHFNQYPRYMLLNPCPGFFQPGFFLVQVGVWGRSEASRGSSLLSSIPVKDLLVTVKESFEHTQRVSHCREPCCPNPACFHYPKYFQPWMHTEVPKSQWSHGVQDSGSGGGIGDWCRRGCQKAPHPSQNPSILPALLLLCTQEEQPCLPAP